MSHGAADTAVVGRSRASGRPSTTPPLPAPWHRPQPGRRGRWLGLGGDGTEPRRLGLPVSRLVAGPRSTSTWSTRPSESERCPRSLPRAESGNRRAPEVEVPRRETEPPRPGDPRPLHLSRAAIAMAARMGSASAVPVQAMSRAVPWSTDVRTMGSPAVMFTDFPKSTVFTGARPWS